MDEQEFEGIEIREDLPVERQLGWALNRVLHELHKISKTEREIMSAITDLQAADQLEASTLVTISQAVSDVNTRFTEALAKLDVSNDPAVAAVAADLKAHVATLNTITAALGAIAPAVTVANPPANPVAGAATGTVANPPA